MLAVFRRFHRLAYFREAWQHILDRSREEIERFIKSDLDLAMQNGTYETVVRTLPITTDGKRKRRACLTDTQ